MIFPIPETKYKLLNIIYIDGKIKVSDLLKKAHASQKAAYAYLNDLITAGIITEERTGKKPLLRHFKPNLATEAGKLIFALLEEHRTIDFLLKHKKLMGSFLQFRREVGLLADTALVFGSFARDSETKDSDIDIAIVGEHIEKKKIEHCIERCFVTSNNRPSVRLFKTSEFINNAKENDDFVLQVINSHIVLVNSFKWIGIYAACRPNP